MNAKNVLFFNSYVTRKEENSTDILIMINLDLNVCVVIWNQFEFHVVISNTSSSVTVWLELVLIHFPPTEWSGLSNRFESLKKYEKRVSSGKSKHVLRYKYIISSLLISARMQ